MSDYLGNLAARSLDPAGGTVRPRLASWFEAVPSAFPALQTEPTAAPAFFEETVEERLAPAPEPVRRPARSRRRTRRAEVVEEEGMEVAGMVKPAAILPPQGGVVRRGGIPFEASPPGPIGATLGSERPHPRPSSPRPSSPVPFQPPSPGEEGDQQDRSNRVPLSRGGEWKGAGEGTGVRALGRGASEAKLAPMPLLQPRVTVAEPAPSPVRREAPPPAPTIQVTIGRIEVRATPAAKAPVVERPASKPAVDLEEYLRQRSRGTGR